MDNLFSLCVEMLSINKDNFRKSDYVQFNYFYSKDSNDIKVIVHPIDTPVFSPPLNIISLVGNSNEFRKTRDKIKKSLLFNEGLLEGGLIQKPDEFYSYSLEEYKPFLIEAYGGFIPFYDNDTHWPLYESNELNNLLFNKCSDKPIDSNVISHYIKTVILKYIPKKYQSITLRTINHGSDVHLEILEDVPNKNEIYKELKTFISKDLKGSFNIQLVDNLIHK